MPEIEEKLYSKNYLATKDNPLLEKRLKRVKTLQALNDSEVSEGNSQSDKVSVVYRYADKGNRREVLEGKIKAEDFKPIIEKKSTVKMFNS